MKEDVGRSLSVVILCRGEVVMTKHLEDLVAVYCLGFNELNRGTPLTAMPADEYYDSPDN